MPTILQIFFFFVVVDYYKGWSSGQYKVIRLYVQGPIRVYMCHFIGKQLGCAYIICSYVQISISGTFPSVTTCPPIRVVLYSFRANFLHSLII